VLFANTTLFINLINNYTMSKSIRTSEREVGSLSKGKAYIDDKWSRGSYRPVKIISDMFKLQQDFRKLGMEVRVVETGDKYKLISLPDPLWADTTIVNWQLVTEYTPPACDKTCINIDPIFGDDILGTLGDCKGFRTPNAAIDYVNSLILSGISATAFTLIFCSGDHIYSDATWNWAVDGVNYQLNKGAVIKHTSTTPGIIFNLPTANQDFIMTGDGTIQYSIPDSYAIYYKGISTNNFKLDILNINTSGIYIENVDNCVINADVLYILNKGISVNTRVNKLSINIKNATIVNNSANNKNYLYITNDYNSDIDININNITLNSPYLTSIIKLVATSAVSVNSKININNIYNNITAHTNNLIILDNYSGVSNITLSNIINSSSTDYIILNKVDTETCVSDITLNLINTIIGTRIANINEIDNSKFTLNAKNIIATGTTSNLIIFDNNNNIDDTSFSFTSRVSGNVEIATSLDILYNFIRRCKYVHMEEHNITIGTNGIILAIGNSQIYQQYINIVDDAVIHGIQNNPTVIWRKSITANRYYHTGLIIYVNGITGHNNWEDGYGTYTKPYKTIEYALLVAPKYINGQLIIDIADGIYDIDSSKFNIAIADIYATDGIYITGHYNSDSTGSGYTVTANKPGELTLTDVTLANSDFVQCAELGVLPNNKILNTVNVPIYVTNDTYTLLGYSVGCEINDFKLINFKTLSNITFGSIKFNKVSESSEILELNHIILFDTCIIDYIDSVLIINNLRFIRCNILKANIDSNSIIKSDIINKNLGYIELSNIILINSAIKQHTLYNVLTKNIAVYNANSAIKIDKYLSYNNDIQHRGSIITRDTDNLVNITSDNSYINIETYYGDNTLVNLIYNANLNFNNCTIIIPNYGIPITFKLFKGSIGTAYLDTICNALKYYDIENVTKLETYSDLVIDAGAGAGNLIGLLNQDALITSHINIRVVGDDSSYYIGTLYANGTTNTTEMLIVPEFASTANPIITKYLMANFIFGMIANTLSGTYAYRITYRTYVTKKHIELSI